MSTSEESAQKVEEKVTIVVESVEAEAVASPEAATSKLEEFAKTSTAAKMSGAFLETAGILKRKFGELTDDAVLAEAGKDQQLLGKVHRLVGSVRGVREAAVEKFQEKKKESLSICRKHGGRLIDVATDFVEDMKKTFLK